MKTITPPLVFLSAEELIQLTGYRQKSKQAQHLTKIGVPFRLDGLGHPIVSWDVILTPDHSNVRPPAPVGYTFDMIADRYEKEVLPTKSIATQRGNDKELKNLREYFGPQRFSRVDDIKPLDIRQFLNQRVVNGKGQTRANREKALFSHIWNKAREWGCTDLPNPCAGVKGYKETGRDIYVENDVYYKVWDCADWPTRDAMDIAYLTGQRPADVLKMNEFDIQDDVLSLKQNKTGKKLQIAVTGELKKVLPRVLDRKEHILTLNPALIVTEEGNRMTLCSLQDRFSKAREKAGIEKNAFQFRDLRAKAATDTEDLAHAQRLLGHTTRTMTEHYTRSRKGDLVQPTK